ncbi:MAG: hypothetical protein LBG72_02900 [Spirochaetaceae bacterium]|nr:hypothetical protein [Spirochaetaceae bacterium]
MKNEKQKAFRLFILLFCCFAFTACNGDDDNNGGDDSNGGGDINTEPKTITITGFPGTTYNSKVAVLTLASTIGNGDEGAAFGSQAITGNPAELSLPLKAEAALTNNWTGTGAYYLLLAIKPASGVTGTTKYFCYTNGTTPNAERTNVPKYDITETTTTIPFNKFSDITNDEPKTIIITDLPVEYNGKVAVLRLDSTVNFDPLDGSAFGQLEIPDNTIDMTLPLKIEPELTTEWTGTGAYYLLLKMGSTAEDEAPDMHFCYTNGTTPNAGLTNIPKYNIREATTRIPFSKFYDITSMMSP